MSDPLLHIDGYTLELTCRACPEQYDVTDQNGTRVAYMRLRYGNFRVSCPDYGGTVVYSATPKGDGVFYSDERIGHLRSGIIKVTEYLANKPFEESYHEENL